MRQNNHDSLFKWLITVFFRDFFAYYFPKRKLGDMTFLDKGLISQYTNKETLDGEPKHSLEGDLMRLIQQEVDSIIQSLVNFEHKRKRVDTREQVMEYAVLTWLLKRQPVWSIVFYTDAGIWREEIPDAYRLGCSAKDGKQFCTYDNIKLSRELSNKLLAEHSLFTSLLAQEANDADLGRVDIVRSIYQLSKEMDPTKCL